MLLPADDATPAQEGSMQVTTRLDRILGFLEISDQLKTIERACYLTMGDGLETDADHTWHTALFALLLHRDLSRDVDLGHVLTLLTIHDLVEIYARDTFGYDAAGQRDQPQREAAAADRLFGELPDDLAAAMHAWWEEFEAARTPEARFAKAMDRLQVLAQNVFTQGRMWRERGVTEAMSRARNRDAMDFDPALTRVFAALYHRAHQQRLWGTADDRTGA
jgi:putative hydrolase of HD superfamily